MKLYEENNEILFTQEPLFLGSGRNIQRYDVMKYPEFYKFGEKMDSQFWKPAEISLSKDVEDFKNLVDYEKRIFVFNLKRQIVLDSIQGRSLLSIFGALSTLPEIEYVLTRIQYQETNHSDTYTYIIRAVYDNSKEIFDTIIDDSIITKHTKNIIEHYEVLYDIVAKLQVFPEGHPDRPNIEVVKDALYLALISWNILEGVRFYVSFACTFAFAENKKMEGNAKELRLIARDENIHLAVSQKIINLLRKKEQGWKDVIERNKEKVISMYKATAEDEIEWAEYLFKDGSIIGLNKEILSNYMYFITNQRMSAIGLPKQYKVTSNPLPWMDSWLGYAKIEERAQETQLASYIIGAVKDDTNEEFLKRFKRN